ncbi:MAG: hypothetical protein JNK60_08550 [Acidobacteria bacterium]|nr:hypothetical protein [Acidobacteriota bacterium]
MVLLGRFAEVGVAGPWEGAGPREVAEAFLRSAGHRLVVIDKTWWVVPLNATSRISVAMRSLSNHGPMESSTVEGAILGALPKRGVDHTAEDVRLGAILSVSYERVSATQIVVFSVLETAGGRDFMAQKLSLGAGGSAQELWRAEIPGPRLAMKVDFDGDGVEDLVFDSKDAAKPAGVVLSGSDGTRLFDFSLPLSIATRGGTVRRVATKTAGQSEGVTVIALAPPGEGAGRRSEVQQSAGLGTYEALKHSSAEGEVITTFVSRSSPNRSYENPVVVEGEKCWVQFNELAAKSLSGGWRITSRSVTPDESWSPDSSRE